MCEVFLLRDLGPFELSVSGEFMGEDALDVVGMVLEHLPPHNDVVVDLNEALVDPQTALALVRLIRLRECSDVSVAVAVRDEQIRMVLLAAGLDPRRSLAHDRSAAAALLAHRPELASIAS